MKISSGDQLARRFYFLNACVTVVLLATIVVSVLHFGAAAWKEPWHVGLVLVGEKTDPGWNMAQYRGMQAACNALGYELLLQEGVRSDAENCRKAIRELAERRANIIFLTNLISAKDMKDMVNEYPHVQFFGMEMDPSSLEPNRYAVRYVEPFYLAGILAGLRTKTGQTGYIAPYPDPEFFQAVNAFAIGVQRVNPSAQVLLAWSGGWENHAAEEQAVRDLKSSSVDVLAYFQDGETIPAAAEREKIDFVSMYGPYSNYSHRLATIRVDWKKTYSHLLRRNLRPDGHLAYTASSLDRSVDIEASVPFLSARERAIFETEYWEIQQGKIVFSGAIFDRNGIQRCGEGETISNQALPQMNWLAKGVKVIGD